MHPVAMSYYWLVPLPKINDGATLTFGRHDALDIVENVLSIL